MMMNLPKEMNLRKPITRYDNARSGRIVHFIRTQNVHFMSCLSLTSRFTLVDIVRKIPQMFHRILFTFLQMRSFPRYGIDSIFANLKGVRLLTIDDRHFFLRVMFLFQNHPT